MAFTEQAPCTKPLRGLEGLEILGQQTEPPAGLMVDDY